MFLDLAAIYLSVCEDDTVDMLSLCVALLLHTNVNIVFQCYEIVVL